MNVGIMYFADRKYGLGHHYRCVTLAEKLEALGHTVYYLSNFQFRRKMFFQLRPHERYDFYHILHQCKLDWLVVDTMYYPDDFILEYKDMFGVNILYLNADEDYDDFEINIIQGCLPGKYSGAEYVILRPNLDKYKAPVSLDNWFVFGGSADKAGLLSAFSHSMDGAFAHLVGTELSDFSDDIVNEDHLLIRPESDESFLTLMSTSDKACITFGMVAWELVYYGVPTYAFSLTRDHLGWAQAMNSEGLIKAYPDVGLPESHKIKEFLSEPFDVAGNSLDLEGATRVVRLMEDYA